MDFVFKMQIKHMEGHVKNVTKLIWMAIIFLGIFFQNALSGGNREADVKEFQKCRFICEERG